MPKGYLKVSSFRQGIDDVERIVVEKKALSSVRVYLSLTDHLACYYDLYHCDVRSWQRQKILICILNIRCLFNLPSVFCGRKIESFKRNVLNVFCCSVAITHRHNNIH